MDLGLQEKMQLAAPLSGRSIHGQCPWKDLHMRNFLPAGGGSILLTGVNSKVPSISYAENGALGCDVQ